MAFVERAKSFMDVFNPLKMEHPESKYSGAGSICFSIMMVTCWLLTWLFRPEQIVDNPIKDRLGYNNWCVGFDTQPANTCGAVFEALIIYFGIRTEWTLIEMASLMHKNQEIGIWAKRMSCAVGLLQISSWALTTMIFAIHPLEFEGAMWVHTGCFLQLVCVMSIRHLNHYLTFCIRTPLSTGLLLVNAFCAYTFGATVIVDFRAFDRKEAIPLHPWFVMAVDYTWFATGLMVPAVVRNNYHEVIVRSLERQSRPVPDCPDDETQASSSASSA